MASGHGRGGLVVGAGDLSSLSHQPLWFCDSTFPRRKQKLKTEDVTKTTYSITGYFLSGNDHSILFFFFPYWIRQILLLCTVHKAWAGF